MKTVLNRLLLPVSLLILWLMLNDTLATGQIVLGAALALALTWAAGSLRPLRARPHRPVLVLKLFVQVAIDITRSNLAVARIIWLGEKAKATPGFIRIPITIRDPHGLAALACILTFTPGTVWSDFSESNGLLTLHVLDLKDEAEWLHIVQQRYERPLLEIFECTV